MKLLGILCLLPLVGIIVLGHILSFQDYLYLQAIFGGIMAFGLAVIGLILLTK